jgi:hypothetical protein
MDKALQIIGNIKKASIKHPYDFEIMRTSAEMVKHTCLTYLDLSNLEYAIKDAHVNRFIDFNMSLSNLLKAQQIIENNLKRRKYIFNDLVSTWEETRLPKGFARHFAYRRPDMTFLIYDEQLLDMEGYLEKLKAYIEYFKVTCLN